MIRGMALYELTSDSITPVDATTFADAEVRERQDLQRLLRDSIEIVDRDVMIVAEEFRNWTDSSRRIDLLGVDVEANLVVFELKRTESGGHMELQAIRYAAMVAPMTFDQTVEAFGEYLGSRGRDDDPRQALLDFLGWEEPDEDAFGKQIRIVLASADFSTEITTSVLWLNDQGLDIRCVRLKPYALGDQILLDVQQLIPLPEAEQYQVRIQAKHQRQRSDSSGERWSFETMRDVIASRKGEAAAEVFGELCEAVQMRVTYLYWGRGAPDRGSAVAVVQSEDRKYHPLSFSARGRVHLGLSWLIKQPPFDEAVLREWVTRVNTIPGIDLQIDSMNRRPAIELEALADIESRKRFLEALGWLLGHIPGHPGDGEE